jgi:hypothetical protein
MLRCACRPNVTFVNLGDHALSDDIDEAGRFLRANNFSRDRSEFPEQAPRTTSRSDEHRGRQPQWSSRNFS